MARLSLHAPSRSVSDPLSSPDPLTEISMAEYSSHRGRSASILSNRSTSTTHRRMKSDDIPSPMKMITEHNASPWRIKVTVEAEPDDGQEFTQRTTRTMKVPLRDEDASTTTRSKSAQRRKSARKSTSPARVTRSRRQSVTDLGIVVLGDDTEEDAWGKRPRSPRKRAGSKSQSTKKGRKSASDAQFEIRKDEDSTQVEERSRDLSEDKSPEMQELDLNKMHTRKRASSLKKILDQEQPVRNVSFNSVASYPTPSPTASEHDFGSEPQDQHPVGLDTVMESEGFTMIDLDTLPSVRQMRNTPEYPTIPEDTTQEPEADESTSNIEAPSIAVTNEDSNVSDITSSPPEAKRSARAKPYKIGHLQLPSSTNVQRHRLVTPMPVMANPLSSPQLPSPPRAPVVAAVDRSPIHSDQVVHAGFVLQDAVTPEHSFLEDQNLDEKHKQQEEKLFGGFSDSMRRELRAELRFGEELGRKQQQSSNKARQASLVFGSKLEQQPQVWRGETTVQRTPVIPIHNKETNPSEVALSQPELPDKTWEANRLRLEEEQQKEREMVIAQAQQKPAIEISDSPQPNSDQENLDETIGDIWLAEARNASSSPKNAEDVNPVSQSPEPPGRKLIPSPWKRGQQIESSQLSMNDSFNSLMLKHTVKKGENTRFGDALLANPDRATRKVSDTRRRRSGMYDAEQMVINTPRRISERIDSDSSEDDQDIEDANFDSARRQLKWRSATDVIDEETKELEDENDSELTDKDFHEEVATTRLHETNLEHVPEQDLSSSPQLNLSKDKQQIDETDHDSTYASGSSEETIDMYRQRTSLSPSKERPHTPRSAMKGTRASFGMALNFATDSDEALGKKVVWAKRSKCMNDLWEESTQSIRSMQTSEAASQSPQPIKQGLNLEASFEVDPQPATQQQASKGFFGWFQKDEQATSDTAADQNASRLQKSKPLSLDGSIDDFVKNDEDTHSDSSFAPTARHNVVDSDAILLRSRTQVPDAAPTSRPKKPSYLLPPSYPSDPNRDPSVPLSTSGSFTTTHFRTLHIIYAKSKRARFHAPTFPEEIRPEIIDLVGDWTLEIDERATMGEDGDFVFGVGPKEARVLERFMREIEEGYHAAGVVNVEWEWTVEELAEKLGRIAVGEKIRDEEKASKAILRSARKARAVR